MTRKISKVKVTLDTLRKKHEKDSKAQKKEAKIKFKKKKDNGKNKGRKIVVPAGSFDFNSANFLQDCSHCQKSHTWMFKYRKTGKLYCIECYEKIFEIDTSVLFEIDTSVSAL